MADCTGIEAGMNQRRKLGFGPKKKTASWEWVGAGVSRALSRHYDVQLFSSRQTTAPECDAMVIIKHKPRPAMIRDAVRKGIPILYCPIDIHESGPEIARDAAFLMQCGAIIVHCERLLPVYRQWCENVAFVEHHNLHGLREPPGYRESGYVLWIGKWEHIHRVIEWLREHPLGVPIRFLTNLAESVTGGECIRFDIPDAHELVNWTAEAQHRELAGARAGFDIKGDSFPQWHKPPVKAQQFIASGIPFAVNADSSAAEYFLTRGFRLAEPSDTGRWLSRGYWEETQAHGARLRRHLTLDNVVAGYQRLIEQLFKKSLVSCND